MSQPSLVTEIARLNPGRNLFEVLPELFAAKIRETAEANPGLTHRQVVQLLLRGRYKTEKEEKEEAEEKIRNARRRREQDGRKIAARADKLVRRKGTGFQVKSSDGLRWYSVRPSSVGSESSYGVSQKFRSWVCNCPDGYSTCKHVEAIKELERSDRLPASPVKSDDFNDLAREVNEQFARAVEIVEIIYAGSGNFRLHEELEESLTELRQAQQLLKRRLRDFGTRNRKDRSSGS